MGLKAILFDLDDTLLWDAKSVDTALEKACIFAAEHENIDPEKLEKDVCSLAPSIYASYENTYAYAKKIGIGMFEAMWADFDDPGELSAKFRRIAPQYRVRVWQEALEKQGCFEKEFANQLATMFYEQRRKYPFLYADTVEVLDALRGKFKLLLLTNGSPDLQQTKLAMSPKLRSYFDRIIISGDFGVGKPDSSIFHHALNQLNVTKDEAIMVGDNLRTDILGAQRIQMKSILIKRQDRHAPGVTATYEIGSLHEMLSIVASLK